MTEFYEPTTPATSRAEVFLGYLDYFRARVIEKVSALPPVDQRQSRLPSGWTPVELLKHLRYMERRWIEWRFEDRQMDSPWGDQHEGRWHVPADETLADLVESLGAQATYTRTFVTKTDLSTVGRPGDNWPGDPPPTLERVLFHMFQEYARHLGQLDVATELAGGDQGE